MPFQFVQPIFLATPLGCQVQVKSGQEVLDCIAKAGVLLPKFGQFGALNLDLPKSMNFCFWGIIFPQNCNEHRENHSNFCMVFVMWALQNPMVHQDPSAQGTAEKGRWEDQHERAQLALPGSVCCSSQRNW